MFLSDTTKQKSSMEQRKHVDIARKLVSTYERGFNNSVVEEEDNDAASFCSADIFELKDLSAIRESDELPVYKTMNFSCWYHRVK